MNGPDISIVVCTQNRADMLRGALASQRSLAAQLATIGQASASTAMASLGTLP